MCTSDHLFTETPGVFSAYPSTGILNFKIKVLFNSPGRRNKFLMHNCTIIKNTNDHHLHIWSQLSCLFGLQSWESFTVLTLTWFPGHNLTPNFIICNDFGLKVWIILNVCFQILAQSKPPVFYPDWKGVEQVLSETHLICKSLVKTDWQKLQLCPSSEISSVFASPPVFQF